MAEAELLAELELAVRLVVVLVHVLQEVQSQGRREWMRKIGVDHNNGTEHGSSGPVIPKAWGLEGICWEPGTPGTLLGQGGDLTQITL